MHFKASKNDLIQLIEKLRKVQTTLPAEIVPLIGRLTDVVAKLALDGTLDSLKKPGAWFDAPLPPTTAEQPYYVKTPVQVEVVNVSAPELTIELFKSPAESVADGSLVTIADPTLPLPAHS